MSGPYDITWAQWGWIMGGFVVLMLLSLAFLGWRDRRRKRAKRTSDTP